MALAILMAPGAMAAPGRLFCKKPA